ncbi:MAG TPA: pitrilysin family protein [Gemmatimonadaceae bacterium]|nr:pitrilysin family protein [Gemmatimonadaceae bacterium]
MCVTAPVLAQTHAPTAAPARVKAAESAVSRLRYKVRRLHNGLTIYSMRDASSPSVAVSAWYDVGAKHDPDGLTGFAHLFEHLLSRKTVNIPYNMINRIVEDAGGVRNAGTSYDYTNYWEVVPASQLETILWTHAERMARVVLDTLVLNSERRAVDQEIRETVLVNPYGPPGRLTSVVIPYNSFDIAPHRRPVVGDSAQLATATLDDVLAFYEAYYGPETASLVIAGNFDEAKLNSLVDKYFAGMQKRRNPAPTRLDIHENLRVTPRSVNVFAPGVTSPAIVSSWKIPAGAHPDLPALAVLDAILSEGDNSRLRRRLVDEKLVTQLSTDLRENKDASYYAIWGVLSATAKVNDVDSVLMQEIARVREQRVTPEELVEARNELLASTLQQRETLRGRSLEVGQWIARAGDPGGGDKRLAAVLKVDAADVQRVAKRYLGANSRVLVRYFDDTQRGKVQEPESPEIPLPRFRKLGSPQTIPREVAAETNRQLPPPASAPVSVRKPVIMERRLASGLTVVAVKKSDIPLATLSLLIKGGASIDPAGRSGLSAMVADVARRGTKTASAKQISAALEALGASLTTSMDFNMRDAIDAASGFASMSDGVVLSVTAPVANLEAAGRILADIAQNATLSAAELETARERALTRFVVSARTPMALASLVLYRAAYGSAPYGNAGVGTPASLKAITVDDLREQYRKWWQPVNAAVVVAGGISPDKGVELARKLFHTWKGDRSKASAPMERAGRNPDSRTIVIDLPDAPQAAVIAAVRAVPRSDPDFFDLSVANLALGVGSTSRLFQEVRTKRALSYSPASWFAPRADEGLIVASATTANQNAAETAEVLLGELTRLGKNPLDADEAARRKVFAGGVYNLLNERSASFAVLIANLIQERVPVSEALQYPDHIRETSAASVNSAIARFISADRATVVVVGDASKIVERLRATRTNIEVIPVGRLDLDSVNLQQR